MQESGAKRPAKLPQRESAEENDRADTLPDACQEGEADGDVPAHLSKMTKSAEAPEATQEAPLDTLQVQILSCDMPYSMSLTWTMKWMRAN